MTENKFQYRSHQIRQQLVQDGVQAVGLWLENADEFACVLLACLAAKVKVLLPPNLLAENQQWLAENGAWLFDAARFADYGNLQKVDKISPVVERDNDSEIWLKTSGSSGNAKIIRKTARQMWTEAETLGNALPFNAKDDLLVIGSVSVQHLYGLTFRIFLPLAMGWRLGQAQLHYPEYLLSESRYQRTLWVSSPALLTHLNLECVEPNLHIAGIISSGGALPPQTAAALRSVLPCPIVEIYGSTETGAIAFRHTAGLWQPMPQSRLGLNEDGALWVENPWISEREQTADAVVFHEHGFELLGRIDRIVKLGDKRVSLVKMEQDLLAHAWVSDCYIGLHPEHQRPLAWVALNEIGQAELNASGRKSLISALRHHLAQSQEKLALPRFWRFTDKLPRNSQAKISRMDFEQICREKTE